MGRSLQRTACPTSAQKNEERAWHLRDLTAMGPSKHWADYVLGVAGQLISRGVEISALSLKIGSDVPEGSGLSSSAALEVSTALALLQGVRWSGDRHALPASRD